MNTLWMMNQIPAVRHVFLRDSMINNNQDKLHLRDILMAIVTSAITMVTNPSIAEIMKRSRQQEIKMDFPFNVTIAIIMIISQNIAGCRCNTLVLTPFAFQ